MSTFFAGVRDILSQGGGQEKFEGARKQFGLVYEGDFPEGTGERPRARGYQYKSEGKGEGRRNKPAWGKLNGKEDGGETPVEGTIEGVVEGVVMDGQKGE